VRFSGKDRTVIDGPFTETRDLIAGYWLWKVKDMDEAVAWLKRCPNPHAETTEVEIRPVFEADDFGDAYTPELRAQEERVLAEAAKNQKAIFSPLRRRQAHSETTRNDPRKPEAELWRGGKWVMAA
jgi:hypothetical protein